MHVRYQLKTQYQDGTTHVIFEPHRIDGAHLCAQRLKRVFGIDIDTFPSCGGAIQIIACIENPAVI